MPQGATLQIGLYYRDANSNAVMVAATSITNSSAAFPTNTHFVQYQVHVPGVKPTDPWAGKNIGIELLSTTDFTLAGGYWDIDNVRLVETVAPDVNAPRLSTGQISFTLLSEPGATLEVLTSTTPTAALNTWSSLGTLTNVSGADTFTNSIAGSDTRFYRVRSP